MVKNSVFYSFMYINMTYRGIYAILASVAMFYNIQYTLLEIHSICIALGDSILHIQDCKDHSPLVK